MVLQPVFLWLIASVFAFKGLSVSRLASFGWLNHHHDNVLLELIFTMLNVLSDTYCTRSG